MYVIDMHCDTLLHLLDDPKASLRKNNLSIDLLKMKKGDYLLQNFACFTVYPKGDAFKQAQRLIDKFHEQMELNSDLIRPVLKYEDIENNRKDGYMSALLTLEEGAVVENDLALLRNYYRLGVRMITLTWNYPNGIGYPNFTLDEHSTFMDMKHLNTKDGLTDFGKAYVKEMERLGIIVDVSHLGDKGFRDILDITTKPFVASHSNARSVCDVARNLSDDMILALAKKGGVMGINFCGDFLKQSDKGDEPSLIEDMVKHIKYIKNLAGIDVIGLGTDFDGITSDLEIKDASMMQKLKEALLKESFSEEEIAKLFYKNVLRVYKEVLK